jgi:hypothetical protein
MGTALDVILSGGASTQEAAETQTQQVEQTQTAEASSGEASHAGEQQTQTGAAEGAATDANATGATPAPESGTTVPLKALEEERKNRQDWKEKAIRFEEELKHLRAQPQQPQGQQQQAPVEMDFDMRLLNERLNTSEMLLRAKHEDVDDKLKVFQEAATKNPALGAELLQQRHPYEWMYKQAQRIQAMNEIGEDPAAYRERVRAEIEAELKGAQAAAPEQQPAAVAAQVAVKPTIPQSLATARSAAPRTAQAWTGPTSLNDILKR